MVTSQTADIPYYIQNLDERGMAVQTVGMGVSEAISWQDLQWMS